MSHMLPKKINPLRRIFIFFVGLLVIHLMSTAAAFGAVALLPSKATVGAVYILTFVLLTALFVVIGRERWIEKK